MPPERRAEYEAKAASDYNSAENCAKRRQESERSRRNMSHEDPKVLAQRKVSHFVPFFSNFLGTAGRDANLAARLLPPSLLINNPVLIPCLQKEHKMRIQRDVQNKVRRNGMRNCSVPMEVASSEVFCLFSALYL